MAISLILKIDADNQDYKYKIIICNFIKKKAENPI